MPAVLAPTAIRSIPVWSPAPLRWSCDRFHDVWDSGAFDGTDVILVEGELIVMPAPNPPHTMATNLADSKLKSAFAVGYVVRVQSALVLGQSTDPIPDIAVVVGTPRDYPIHPTTAVLVVEVADSSLDYDRGDKANLYAAGGIADYWVIDIPNRQLHVFREPAIDPAVRHGHRYRQQTTSGELERVAPLAAQSTPIAVADLLP